MPFQKKTYPRTQVVLLSAQLIGDAIMSFAGLSAAYFLRFETPLRNLGVVSTGYRSYREYLPLLFLGTVFLLVSYAYLDVYDGRLLLRTRRALLTIVKAIGFWLVAFLATSLVFKLEPSISRMFALLACGTTLLTVAAWRGVFQLCLRRTRLRERLTQRVLIVGWNKEAADLAAAIHLDPRHPYEVIGIVGEPSSSAPFPMALPPVRGTVRDLRRLLEQPVADVLVLADLDLAKEEIVAIAGLCERTYTEFKVVPSFFQTFISQLQLQSISGYPMLGIAGLPMQRLHNVIFKRTVDIAGALVGLTFSLPVMAVLAWFIKRESRGPILYRQTRTGMHGRPFEILKLRSMRVDAEVETGARWAVAGDPRRTRIGAFMRETNLDELPQFWNVLVGDMSLVGPRPERPELIAKFQEHIPHYAPRHEVRPGITGWAQVNGLRGDTDLVERVKYDLYYIENWSLFFDGVILIQTFFRRKNAY